MLAVKIRVNRHIEFDEDAYMAFCPEFGIATQADTLDEVKANFDDALEGFFEIAEPSEILHRLTEDITEYLDIWKLTDRKAEFDKSRQQILQTIMQALIEEVRVKNGVAPAHLANDTVSVAKHSQNGSGALAFQYEVAPATSLSTKVAPRHLRHQPTADNAPA